MIILSIRQGRLGFQLDVFAELHPYQTLSLGYPVCQLCGINKFPASLNSILIYPLQFTIPTQ